MANVLIPKKSTVAAKVPGTSDLALGEIAINHADAKLYARHPVSGTVQEIGAAAGSLSIDTTAADLFSATSGTLSADDLGSDKIYFWDDSAGRATGLDLGTGLAITGTTLNNTGSLTGTGSVDNAILRADGAGGAKLQTSGLVAEDAIVSFTSITGDALTDVITATGSAFTDGQPVRFTALTGGSGLNTTTNYFVREASGATFKVETSIGGGAINFTTNITAGTLLTGHSVSTNVTLSENTTATNSDLVLTPKGTGALIAGPKPDGTATGGNARGNNAVDFQTSRTAATQVASGTNSVICKGTNNTAAGERSFIGAGTNNQIPSNGTNCAMVGGRDNIFAGSPSHSFIGGGTSNRVDFPNSAIVAGNTNYIGNADSGFIGGGFYNRVDVSYTSILGGENARADRYGMQAHASGRFSPATGNFGDAQRARFVLRCKTTTNAAVEMALDGGTTYLTIPSGKVMFMNIKVVGSKSDGTAVATYERQYAVKNVAGTSSQVYAPITIGTDNAAGTTIEVATVDAGDYVRIRPTGITSETWRWVASVDAVEVAYGT